MGTLFFGGWGGGGGKTLHTLTHSQGLRQKTVHTLHLLVERPRRQEIR